MWTKLHGQFLISIGLIYDTSIYFFILRLLAQEKAWPKKIRSHGYCVFLFKFAGQTFGCFIERFGFFKDVKSHIKDFTLN